MWCMVLARIEHPKPAYPPHLLLLSHSCSALASCRREAKQPAPRLLLCPHHQICWPRRKLILSSIADVREVPQARVRQGDVDGDAVSVRLPRIAHVVGPAAAADIACMLHVCIAIKHKSIRSPNPRVEGHVLRRVNSHGAPHATGMRGPGAGSCNTRCSVRYGDSTAGCINGHAFAILTRLRSVSRRPWHLATQLNLNVQGTSRRILYRSLTHAEPGLRIVEIL